MYAQARTHSQPELVKSTIGRRSSSSDASIAAMVAPTHARTVFVREMRGVGGRTSGRKSGGARPVRSVSRHAVRSAASSCQRVVSMENFPIALKMERP